MKYYSKEHIEALQYIIDELDEKIDEEIAKFDTEWFKRDRINEFSEYYRKTTEIVGEKRTISNELELEIRMNKEPEFTETSNIGDIMSLENFIGHAKGGGLLNSDGFGIYMKDGKESNVEIYPSDVKKENIRQDFDTIIWFNK